MRARDMSGCAPAGRRVLADSCAAACVMGREIFSSFAFAIFLGFGRWRRSASNEKRISFCTRSPADLSATGTSLLRALPLPRLFRLPPFRFCGGAAGGRARETADGDALWETADWPDRATAYAVQYINSYIVIDCCACGQQSARVCTATAFRWPGLMCRAQHRVTDRCLRAPAARAPSATHCPGAGPALDASRDKEMLPRAGWMRAGETVNGLST